MSEQKIYTLKELEELFPFGKTKLLSLCRAGLLPVVKVGRDYISTPELIERWMRDNEGKEILY